MTALAIPVAIPAMTPAAIDKVRQFEERALALPQVALETSHVLHAGLYCRTVRIPAGVMIAGALIKIATVVIVEGEALMWVGEESRRLSGYTVLPASAGRKQAFLAIGDIHITMVFPSVAKTVEEAEKEFTDEDDRLVSRRDTNQIIVSGE